MQEERACRARRRSHRPRLGRLGADVAEQAGEQRPVDRLVARGVDASPGASRRPLPARLGRAAAHQLRVHVAPFGQPQVRHEVRAAGFDRLPVRQRALRLARRRTPTARSATGNPNARRGTADAPDRPPARARAGRSRGSGTASALAMTSASARQPASRAPARCARCAGRAEAARARGRAASATLRRRRAPSSCSSW